MQHIKQPAAALTLVLAGFALVAPDAQADVIALYNFNNSINGATAGEDVIDLSSSDTEAITTASALSSSIAFALSETGGPVNPTAVTNSSGGAGQNPYIHNGSVGGGTRNIDESYAYNIAGRATRNASGGGEKFLSFTVAMDPGVEVDLTSFSFKVRQSAVSGTSNGANTFRVLVNGVQIGDTQNHNTTSVVTLSFDLSSVATLTDDFTVQLGLFGGGGTDRSAVLDDLTLNGSVTDIPEPASLVLLGLGALCMLGRRGHHA